MRRRDKEVTDRKAMEEVLARADWGTLGLVTARGTALLVPINHVFHNGRLYFHSARTGEKMETLRTDARATYLVVDAYARIPSYAFDPAYACPASQCFKSVIAYGRVAAVEAPERKAEILQTLMAHLQPEGGHQPITVDSPQYRAAIASVAVLEMTIERMTGKFGLGQALKPDQRAAVEAVLGERGGPQDARTLAAMAGIGSGSPQTALPDRTDEGGLSPRT